MLCLYRFSQNATHDESTKSRRETYLCREHRHGTAHAQCHHQHHLVVNQLSHLAQEQRDGKDAHHKPQHQEESYLHHRAQHLTSVGVVATGYGTQHHHHHDSQDVLQNQYRHHQACKLLLAQS